MIQDVSYCPIFEVSIALRLRILVFLVVTLSSGVIHSQCCEGMYCPHLHGSKSLQSMPDIEEMEGICSSTSELVG